MNQVALDVARYDRVYPAFSGASATGGGVDARASAADEGGGVEDRAALFGAGGGVDDFAALGDDGPLVDDEADAEAETNGEPIGRPGPTIGSGTNTGARFSLQPEFVHVPLFALL
ncbi:MAG: hypothetical protein SFX72_06970 [Isosphaeraceae bacterium]|nr:hypothetical protein [Isosphaeraceae bacterium]